MGIPLVGLLLSVAAGCSADAVIDADSSDAQVDASVASDAAPSSAPVVERSHTYSVKMTTHVYGQGLTHPEWGQGPGTPTDLSLDLFQPEGASGPRPLVVVIHGGGFIGGSKEAGPLVGIAQTLAARGWVCASINYRLAGVHGTVPQALLDSASAPQLSPSQRDQILSLYPAGRDAKAAVRWLTANASTFSIDPDYITAMGGSAGSFLSVMLGTTEPEDYRDELDAATDPTLSTTNLTSPSRVHTIIDHWGGSALVDLLDEVWGLKRFDATDAPVSIIHGTIDAVVAFAEAENLRAIWSGTGVAHDFHELAGAGHGAWGAMIDGKTLDEVAHDFIVEHQGLRVRP